MNDKYPLALPPGTVLAGQYIVERVLGQGGFGITYEATDHKTNERVAVKEFFPDAMATRTNNTTVSAFSGERGESFAYGKTCFLQEAETLAKFIGNENIVRIHSYFEENETAYFVMDFIEGTSFDEYLKERGGKIPYEEAAQILIPVMDALSVVHSQGIVHRDVTPDNIYITKEGIVKLLDFGAARYSLGDKSRSLDIILKHGFAPKEQYTRRGKQGPYTDVYALGATFYFSLTGKRPPDSVERMDEDDLIPPSVLGIRLSEAAEDAILKALSVQPADRFQSMMSFKSALLNLPQSDTVQPPLVVVGGRDAVPQTYFTAPEQTDIPRSGFTGSPAPEPGQDPDLQDLAATMKTAGKLAGKLAGKMAGKVAEKTAETAGVMAGTAGKMSEIMAAKKAETAEKLAARMAEREAEKAARQAAAESARQAAAEAAESARQAAEAAQSEDTAWDASEGTVGRTVGGAPEIPSGSSLAKLAAGKKRFLIPAVAIAAILIGILVFKPGAGNDRKENTTSHSSGTSVAATPEPTATPKPTTTPKITGTVKPNAAPEPTTTPEPAPTPEPANARSGSVALVSGCDTANIMNGGIIARSNFSEFDIIGGGREIMISDSTVRITADDGAMFSNLMIADEKLYALESTSIGHGYMSTYDLNTSEIESLDALNDYFTRDISQVLITEDYFFIGKIGETTKNDVGVYRVSRDLSTVERCFVTDIRDGFSGTFTLSDDGWLYYTCRENDQPGIRRMRADTLEADDQRLIYNTHSDVVFNNLIVVGDYLYGGMYDQEGSFYLIFRMDREAGYEKGEDPIWEVSDELGTNVIPYVCGFNVNVNNGDIYCYLFGVDDEYPILYEVTGYDDGTYEAEVFSQDSFCPNLSYFMDGSYEVSFYHRGQDDDDFGQFYRRYDSNGNRINA